MKTLTSSFRLLLCPLLFLALFVFSETGCSNATEESPVTTTGSVVPLTGKFFTLSDVHFNPFFDTTLFDELRNADVSQWEAIFLTTQNDSFGRYGADSYYRMMDTAFVQMKNTMANPDFIIITGDFLGHNFQKDFSDVSGIAENAPNFRAAADSFITKTIQFMALQLHAQFPSTPFFPVLGNNDDYCGDYMIQPNDSFLTMFANAWAPYFDSVNRASLLSTFPSTGHYTASLPGYPDHVILGMNTMFFSKKNTSTCMPTDTNSGHDEMSWLMQTLAQCQQQNQTVWFTCHIPPGAEVHSGVKALQPGADCDESIKMMWKSEYNDSFIALVNQYDPIINGAIGGHTHMDEYRLITDPSGNAVSFFHINPSISPIDGNNPGFQLFTYDAATMTMLDYTSYVFHGIDDPANGTWTMQYQFSRTYGASSITAATLGSIYQQLNTDTALQQKYCTYFSGGSPHAAPQVWKPYWCCIGATFKEGFRNCVCEGMK